MDATPPATPPPDPNPFEPPHAPGGPPRRRWRPMSLAGKILGSAAVALSGGIAFVGTCFPIGFAAFTMGGEGRAAGIFVLLGILVGTAVALVAAFAVFRLIFRSRSRELPPPGDEVGR